MKKLIFTIVFAIVYSAALGQEKLTQFKNTLGDPKVNLKDIYTLVNNQNDNFSILITDAKNVYLYNFDHTFSIKNKLLFPNKRRKYKDIIGYSILENGDYKLYLKNKKNDFLEIHFDIHKKTSSSKEFKFLRDYETYLQSMTVDNKFYLISGSKEVNGLYFYTFDNGEPKRNKIDIDKLDLISSVGQKSELMPMLIKSSPLLKFDENTPNSVEISSKRRKMYVQNESTIFTLNNHSAYTQIIKVNLKTLSATSFKLENPLMDIKRRKKKSNSHIVNNNVFTATFSKEKFSLRITDFLTKEIKKEFLVSKTDSITFKNTPVTTSYSIFKNYREIKKTKRFLAMITNSAKPAINVQFNKNKYYLTIGGFLGEPNVGKVGFGSGFNTSNTTLPYGYSVSYTNYSFGSYISSSNFIKFSSVFDDHLNHLKNEKTTNAFEKIKDYLDPERSKFKFSESFFIPFATKKYDTADAIFKYKDFYIYIDYDKKDKSFELLKFTN